VRSWWNLDFAAVDPSVIRADLLGTLPVPGDTMEVVYSSHFLEHVPRPQVQPFLRECRRVLRPGGSIRLVTPDLQFLCREYLRLRDAGAHDRADFVTLELLDQCVRMETGGALGRFYERAAREADPGERSFIREMTGEDLSARAREPSTALSRVRRALREPRLARAWMARAYRRAILRLLPRAFRQQNVSQAEVGERHLWLYDFHSLQVLLLQAGFTDVRRLDFDRSLIPGFPLEPLDVAPDGRPRKGAESLYVEARRPAT
jgi:SAM-dependent methyltransferase